MSSATKVDMASVGEILRSPSAVGQVLDAESASTQSGEQEQRTARLARLWSFYRAANHAHKRVSWDGQEQLEDDAIITAGFIPPGFYDAGANGATVSLRHRRPSAPYALARVIVNRFTGLLFSESRHPQIRVPDDVNTEDWLQGFAEETRLWARMILARTYGGAMGSVVLGFVFKHGRPALEVHDPKWCVPEFLDREEFILKSLEKRYLYQDMVRDPESGTLVQSMFWYRRVIDEQREVIWPKVPAIEGEEPDWRAHRSREVVHNFGFCPIVWVQNLENQESIDGDPDCYGTYDMLEAMDALISQANRGILANCDPTLIVTTDDELDDDLKKGSDNAIKLSAGGNAQYLEIQGAGPKAAMEQAADFEKKILRVTRCVLDDNFGGPARTEREVDQNYSNMIEQASTLREQYGERGIKRLLSLVLQAARKLTMATVDKTKPDVPRLRRNTIQLPRNRTTGQARELGKGELIELDWPDWYEPSLDDANKAVDAASKALNASIIDTEHAVKFISHYFKVENVGDLVEELEAKQAAMFSDPAAAFDTTAPAESTEIEPPAAVMPEEADNFELPPAVAETLNGAQVKSLADLVMSVYAGAMPAAAAAEIILAAFPQVSSDAVQAMLSAPTPPNAAKAAGVESTAEGSSNDAF